MSHNCTVYFDPCRATNPLRVDTLGGPIFGLINSTTPSVAQFLGIPFAEPPLGQLRWAPPIVKSPVSSIDATQFDPSYPQYESTIASVYNIDSRDFLITPGKTSGDCLTLNIWAPVGAEGRYVEKLPVIVWIYGGGFQTGGGEIGYQIPSRWVQRSQAHIVVGIKYTANSSMH
jgi:acetylcholinesterase